MQFSKLLFSLFGVLAAGIPLGAQNGATSERHPISLEFQYRADYQRSFDGSKSDADGSGFRGYITNLILKGEPAPRFSYYYRQRLNGINRNSSFFESVDQMYLQYQITPDLSIKAGKWVVFVGGWEFEPAPIDIYQLGEFTYQMPCYEWGVTMKYQMPGGHDQFHVQMTESPFRKMYQQMTGQPADTYGYGLVWTGQHHWYESLWSVNLMEYAPGQFINYLSLGNRFHLTDQIHLDLDVMNRAALQGQSRFFFSDFSIFAQLAYRPMQQLSMYLKGSYDQNDSDSTADLCVLPGTHISRLGGGVEYWPWHSIRLHATYHYSWGVNTNPQGVLHDRNSIANVGVSWYMQLP